MRQLLQNVSTGEISVEVVPPPQSEPGSVLVATRFSLISAGTERALVDLGKASLISKARARPDLVRKVVDSARQDGLTNAVTKVRGRLGEPKALGYSLSGTVVAGALGGGIAPGDLVACAGAGLASHAELVRVPANLCAKVPEGVAPSDAAYATVATIALHGVRLAQVSLGSVSAVIGLGLVGQLTMQLLRAAGCVPVGFDPDPERTDLASAQGFAAFAAPDDFEAHVRLMTAGRGADAVLVTAASRSPAPLARATSCARDRAVVVVVGDVPIETPRAALFQKELQLVVSRSYGPGRYDPEYEERGRDYPPAYVRWTEGRNLEEVLRLMSVGSLNPSALTSHTFELGEGPAAYELLSGEEASLGILLRYDGADTVASEPSALPRAARSVGARVKSIVPSRRRPRVGVIGAGLFARSVLLPNLAKVADIQAVATRTGVSAKSSGERFGASLITTDPLDVIAADLDAVVIATRHDMHADLTIAALQAGKHVYVEKPLALDPAELQRVAEAAHESGRVLMVGFNRRFAPMAAELRACLSGRGPLLITYRANAGRIPAGHWVLDPRQGGGRIVGEACHFIDFAAFLCGGSPMVRSAQSLTGASEPAEENVTINLTFPDGSVAVVVYASLGDPSLEKERIEVFGEAGAGVLSDFRTLELHSSGRRRSQKSSRDKGHANAVAVFAESCHSGVQPWPVAEMVAVTEATYAARRALVERDLVA